MSIESDVGLKDETRISLKIWLPVVIGIMALFTFAMSFGRKDQRLDDNTKDLERVKKDYVTQDYFNMRMNEMESRWDKRLERMERNQESLSSKADVLLRREK